MLFSSEGDFARIHENVMGRALLGGDFFLVEETRKTCLLGGISTYPPTLQYGKHQERRNSCLPETGRLNFLYNPTTTNAASPN